jgi:hypothetical protein
MKSTVTLEEKNKTHIDWELWDVTSRMLNWFWCNMEKGDNLWHPNQHHNFSWMPGYTVQDKKGFIGSIHIAPQTWSDGKDLNIYIRAEKLEDVPEYVRNYIKYDHAIIVSGISMTGENVKPDDPSLGWRLHQWQKTDDGVIGMSTGITPEGADTESGEVWAKHAIEEVSNWEVFLPDLFRLYKVIAREDISPYQSFRLTGKGKDAVYADIK